MPSASIREVSAHFPARGILFADRNECGCRLTQGPVLQMGTRRARRRTTGGRGWTELIGRTPSTWPELRKLRRSKPGRRTRRRRQPHGRWGPRMHAWVQKPNHLGHIRRVCGLFEHVLCSMWTIRLSYAPACGFAPKERCSVSCGHSV